MPYQTDLLDAMREVYDGEPVTLSLRAGWPTSGSSTFNPRCVVDHHTASSIRGGHSPALGVCANGRPGLPGPLCNVHLSRPVGSDNEIIATLIAAGRANHAGIGSWRGLSGNTQAWGIEPENNGIGEPWHPNLLRVMALTNVAMMRVSGITDESFVCGHKEWTSRKIDPHPVLMSGVRSLTRQLIVPKQAIVPIREPQEGDVTFKPGDSHQHIRFFKFIINIVREGNFLDRSSSEFDEAMAVQVRRFQDRNGYSQRGADDWGHLTSPLRERLIIAYMHKRLGIPDPV